MLLSESRKKKLLSDPPWLRGSDLTVGWSVLREGGGWGLCVCVGGGGSWLLLSIPRILNSLCYFLSNPEAALDHLPKVADKN